MKLFTKLVTFFLALVVALLIAIPVFAQTPGAAGASGSTGATHPAVFLGGITFNQAASPKTNATIGGLYQTGSTITSGTFANLVPVEQTNAVTKAKFWAVSTAVTQAVFLTPYSSSNFRLLTGGSLGASFTQATPSGTNVTVAATISAIPMWYFGKSKWGLATPIQGIYSGGAWIPVISITPFFSPNR